MLSSFLSLTRVAVIAHRGGAALRPENTFEAFDHAVALGVDGLECDVHLSADREVVVIHDPTLDRTTDTTGPVNGLTAKELARVDAGFHFGAANGYPFRGRQIGVSRLRDLLDRYRSLPVVVEMKGGNPELAERVVGDVRSAGAGDRVILAGFSHTVLDTARRLAPDLVTSASFDEGRLATSDAQFWNSPRPTALRLFQMPYETIDGHRLGPEFVQAARRAGLPVQVWVVDDPADMQRLISWGVTGIITDRPDIALREALPRE